MKQILLFIIIFFVILSAIAQESSSIYLVQFKDKNASEYSVDKPSEYLSAKAIERRQVQHIPINSTDLPVNINYINQVKAVDVSILNHSKWLNAITISGADVNKINAIKVLSCVKSISKIKDASNPQLSTKFDVEQKSKISTLEKSNNSSATSTALNYGLSYSQAHQLNVDCLHAMGYMGQGVTIAVLDAGFQDVNILPAFDSLRMNNRLLGTWDFVMGDSMVFEDNIHGMEVLSCMTGNLPGELIGTAPKANFWLLRTEDAGSESISEEVNWLLGAEFADSVGADVINSSLGYTTFDNSANNHTYADLDGNTTIITKAADWAASKGILVVSSAGNYGTGPWYKIGAPADADSILTVGAWTNI
jgi:serine protease AprX